MQLRWLIRGFAIALLTLCLSVWAWSYFYCVCITYTPWPNKPYSVMTYTGGAFFSSNLASLLFDGQPPPSWEFSYDRETYSLSDYPDHKRFMGFAYSEFIISPGVVWPRVGIPFWFFSLFFAGLLWFVWRQTRPKTAGRGFPVEITQPNQPDCHSGSPPPA